MFKIFRSFLSVLFVAVSFTPAFAAASDPFGKATSKTEELITYIATYAMYASILVLTVVGVLTMFGKVRMEMFYKVGGGALIVIAASSIGNWLFA
jgi:type IV secretory pathway VirB2 component (pilin)